MSPVGLPLQRGDFGDAVQDLHRRLKAAGFGEVGEANFFDEKTENAVKQFQADRSLVVDGICARQTWAALVDATFRLGDRMLYLRYPMTHGDDVADLQLKLGNLGFDAGWLDGIFGSETEEAVREFQQNQGLNVDGTVGRSTVSALERLAGRQFGDKTITEVHQREALRQRKSVSERRILLGETGGLPALVNALARLLQLAGATVLTLHHPNPSSHARIANGWGGDLYLGVALATSDYRIAFFQTKGFTSSGGCALAQQVESKMAAVLPSEHTTVGMRLPILRETKMTAVWCRMGPASQVVEQTEAIAKSLRDAVIVWCDNPETFLN